MHITTKTRFVILASILSLALSTVPNVFGASPGLNPTAGSASATPRDPSDRDGDGRIGEETAIKERIRAYIEMHGVDGKLTGRQMLERARFTYAQWLADGRHLGQKGVEGDGFVNIGPVNGAGRVAAVAPHPTIDGVLLQGAASGGVWKTLDGGHTWYPTTDGLSDLSVGAVAWAPGNPDVAYLGTGEGDTLIAGGTGYIPGIGLLRSDDAGETWTFPSGDADPFVDLFFALNVDPADEDIVFAATNEGLFRTLDGGVTWENQVPSVGGSYAFTEVVRSSSNPDLLYASQWCEGGCPPGTGRVMRSTDRGQTWAPVTGNGLPGLTGYFNRAALAVAPSDDQILYLATNITRGDNPESGIYRSEDGGENWTATSLSTHDQAKLYLGSQSWYDNTIVVSPTDPDVVVAAGVWYVLTTDGGQTWTNKNPYQSGGGMGTGTLPHVDAHDLQYQGDVLWVGNDGGVWMSENDGQTWTGRNDGVVTRQYYGMAVDPVNRERVLGGTQDNGTNLRRDEGDDTFDLVLGGDGFECGINPMMPEIMYGTIYYTAVYRTNPTTGRFRNISPDVEDEDAPFITPLTIHPSNPNIILTGAERLWRSDNGGDSWYGLPRDTVADVTGFPWVTGGVWAIAATPADPDRIVMSKGGVVYTSSDGGLTWFAGVVGQKAYNIDISPHDADLMLAAMEVSSDGRGVRRSTDGGRTWSDSGTGLPRFNTQVVRFDPTDPDVAYAGTDVGLYRSTDAGISWSRWGDGLPAASIHDLRILPDGSMMRIGTYGRGFWELAIDRPENTRPSIEITTPSATTISVDAGESLALAATATDADGDALTVDWYVTTDYEIAHQTQGTGSVNSSFQMTVPSGGMFEIAARVTDVHGEQDVDFFSVLAQEPADQCDTRRVVPGNGPFPYQIYTSNQFAAKDGSDPILDCVDPATSHPDAGREASLWFEFTPSVSGTYVVSTCGSAADTMLSAWTGPACGPYTAVPGACNDDDEGEHCLGARTDSYLELPLEAGVTTRIMVGSWRGLTGGVVRGIVTLNVDCLDCSLDEHRQVIAASANADGLNQTTWVTDLDLFNPGSGPVAAELVFLPAESDNSDATGVQTTIPAGEVRSYSDVVGSFLGAEGSGSIRIDSTGPLHASSRTFNTDIEGTFGQYIPGMSMDRAVGPGAEVRLNGLAGNGAFRTNIGFANASDSGASVEVDLLDADGSVIKQLQTSVQPWGWAQLNRVFQGSGAGEVRAASAVVRNISGSASVFVYASVVDDGTGDPTFVTETPPGSTSEDLWVAASAHVGGVGDSVWRTDLWITNEQATPVTATLSLLKRDSNNSTPVTAGFDVGPNRSVRLDDVLDAAFQFNGAAALRVALSGPASVSSRTYNLADDGTFGQFIPAVPASHGIDQGQTGLLMQLRSTTDFRTNIGFVNITDQTMAVNLEVRASSGALLNTETYILQPYGHVQDGSAFPVGNNIEGAYALITTPTYGGRFLAYASVVDNQSDDPVFLPARVLD